MSETLTKFPPLARLRDAFEGLSARERSLLLLLGAVVVLLLFLIGGYTLYDRIDTLEEKNQAMEKALSDIAKKRGPYLQARARQAQLDSRIGNSPLQLSGFLEGIAKESGIEIRETNPRTPEPLGKKYIQQSVDLRLGRVKLEPLLKFMHRLETYPSNLVLVTQLSIRNRDDKHEEFEVDMTVSTYEHAPKSATKPQKPEGDSDGKKEAL
jgi:type II secretory pathway component PulM